MCFHDVAPNRGVFWLQNPMLRCSAHILSALRFYWRQNHTVQWGSAKLDRTAPHGKKKHTVVNLAYLLCILIGVTLLLSMDIDGHNRLADVYVGSLCRPQWIVLLCSYLSIAVVGDNGCQASYFSTFLSRQYVGQATYWYKLPTTIFGETCLSIAFTDDNRPFHCTIFYCYCNIHCLLSRVCY